MSTELLPSLTQTEQSTRDRLEGIVHKLEIQFVEVGTALSELLESRLYRSTHATFDAYCRATFKFCRSRAYRLINFGEALKQIAEVQAAEGVVQGDIPEITERDTRELEKVPKEQRKEIVKAATKKCPSGKGLGKAIKEAVKPHIRSYNSEPVPASAYVSTDEPESDSTVHPVIQAILDDFEARKPTYNQLPLLAPRKIVDMVIAVIEPLL